MKIKYFILLFTWSFLTYAMEEESIIPAKKHSQEMYLAEHMPQVLEKIRQANIEKRTTLDLSNSFNNSFIKGRSPDKNLQAILDTIIEVPEFSFLRDNLLYFKLNGNNIKKYPKQLNFFPLLRKVDMGGEKIKPWSIPKERPIYIPQGNYFQQYFIDRVIKDATKIAMKNKKALLSFENLGLNDEQMNDILEQIAFHPDYKIIFSSINSINLQGNFLTNESFDKIGQYFTHPQFNFNVPIFTTNYLLNQADPYQTILYCMKLEGFPPCKEIMISEKFYEQIHDYKWKDIMKNTNAYDFILQNVKKHILSFNNNAVLNEKINEFFEKIKSDSFRELDLGHTNLNDEQFNLIFKSFRKIFQPNRLESINLSYNNLESIDYSIFEFNQDYTNLKKVNLTNNKIRFPYQNIDGRSFKIPNNATEIIERFLVLRGTHKVITGDISRLGLERKEYGDHIHNLDLTSAYNIPNNLFAEKFALRVKLAGDVSKLGLEKAFYLLKFDLTQATDIPKNLFTKKSARGVKLAGDVSMLGLENATDLDDIDLTQATNIPKNLFVGKSAVGVKLAGNVSMLGLENATHLIAIDLTQATNIPNNLFAGKDTRGVKLAGDVSMLGLENATDLRRIDFTSAINIPNNIFTGKSAEGVTLTGDVSKLGLENATDLEEIDLTAATNFPKNLFAGKSADGVRLPRDVSMLGLENATHFKKIDLTSAINIPSNLFAGKDTRGAKLAGDVSMLGLENATDLRYIDLTQATNIPKNLFVEKSVIGVKLAGDVSMLGLENATDLDDIDLTQSTNIPKNLFVGKSARGVKLAGDVSMLGLENATDLQEIDLTQATNIPKNLFVGKSAVGVKLAGDVSKLGLENATELYDIDLRKATNIPPNILKDKPVTIVQKDKDNAPWGFKLTKNKESFIQLYDEYKKHNYNSEKICHVLIDTSNDNNAKNINCTQEPSTIINVLRDLMPQYLKSEIDANNFKYAFPKRHDDHKLEKSATLTLEDTIFNVELFNKGKVPQGVYQKLYRLLEQNDEPGRPKPDEAEWNLFKERFNRLINSCKNKNIEIYNFLRNPLIIDPKDVIWEDRKTP